MDYYQPMRDQYIHKEMYPVDHRKDFFPKNPSGPGPKLAPKPPCAPKFVTKIEGNAVEEGARVFFEGIVDSQPQPVFTWYFDDEEILPGDPGWEEAEIHHSRKMSTLILRYAREHHMGKYTLVTQNRLGHDVSECDLIVRKKQFPPVFWRRLVDIKEPEGIRLVAEVEVGGWPLPEVVWYHDGEILVDQVFTENYNGFFNAYVPERKVEVRRVDQIRHCVIFHRLAAADAGTYVCRAVNPLGEAVCEAEFEVDETEIGMQQDLYLPEKWRTGNRLTWKDEDARLKPFADGKGLGNDDVLTEEDIAHMTKRITGRPLNRTMEYLASLPPYQPLPSDAFGTLEMPFSPETALRGIKEKSGRKGGRAARPSKFIPGDIVHRGFASDDFGRICPVWKNPVDPRAADFDPFSLHHHPVAPNYPAAGQRPPRAKSPDAPPVWESDADIAALYKMLSAVGQVKVGLSDVRSDRYGNANQVRLQAPPQRHLKEQADARRQLRQHANKGDEMWKKRLEADRAGAQANAEAFTSEFMKVMYGEKQEVVADEQEVVADKQESPSPPPPPPPQEQKAVSLPPPSVEEERKEILQVKEEFIPVKEKVKLITRQQEEIYRREEELHQQLQESGEVIGERVLTGEALKGAVRILPPSPITVSRPAAVGRPDSDDDKKDADDSEEVITTKVTKTTTTVTARKVDIPVLEDKYHVGENLDELVTASDDNANVEVTKYSETSYQQVQPEPDTSRDSVLTQETSSSFTYAATYNRTESDNTEEQFQALVREQQQQSGGGTTQVTETTSQYYHHEDDVDDTHQLQLRLPHQNPLPEPERLRYRSPPTAPFQPRFYRMPKEDSHGFNPEFKLPSQKSGGKTVVVSSERRLWSSSRQ